MKKTAVFRFEASPKIGVGHAMRCCVLADALAALDWDCSLITHQHTYDLIPDLKRFNRIEPNVWDQTPQECDLLVVDHYDLDSNYESNFRPCVKKIMVIDDLANRKHDCDILLDQTFGRTTDAYYKLVPEQCLILVGTEYSLIRDDIRAKRIPSLIRRKNNIWQRALISMGGTDAGDFTLEALDMLKAVNYSETIDLILGFAFTKKTELDQYISSINNKCEVHFNADLGSLIAAADFAIGAAGGSVWERACLGLPQYILQTADNQALILKNLQQKVRFASFYNDKQNSSIMHHLTVDIDGLGCSRIINHINIQLDKMQRSVWHCKVTSADVDLIFSWVQNPVIWRYSFNHKVPDYSEHQKWFASKVANPLVIFEKIMVAGTPCGSLRLDYIENGDYWRLSWYVIPEFQQAGIGSIALKFAQKLVINQQIKAEVLEENTASKIAMEKSGFKFISKAAGVQHYAY